MRGVPLLVTALSTRHVQSTLRHKVGVGGLTASGTGVHWVVTGTSGSPGVTSPGTPLLRAVASGGLPVWKKSLGWKGPGLPTRGLGSLLAMGALHGALGFDSRASVARL